MIRTTAWRCIVLLGSVAFVTAKAQSLPEGSGKAEFQRICSTCHSVDRSTSQRMSRAEWAGVVSDMVARGAQGSSAELDNVVSYLTTNFGKSNSSREHVASPEAPLRAEEIAKAKTLIQQNGCLSCHRFEEAGSYLGPYLDGIGAHRSPEQLQAALVSPKRDVLPENRTVRLVTGDGKSITGRLLNQDGFSVQIIDSSGRLNSFDRLHLREFAIVTTNPMPSYAGKLSSQDLADLVRYLSSLKNGAAQ